MATCRGCGETFETAELTRHERRGLVTVHCPSCGRLLGDYNAHTH